MENKVILTVATTGAWSQKKDTPYVPIQLEEIAEDNPKFLENLRLAMQERNVKPEIEIFDAGMEDNIFYSIGKLAESNVEFVERTKRIVKELGKEIATPDEARAILGLKK
ncbi:MAG: 3-keto-5-aminohexanoate cleavage protein [Clostridiaceae bacterium]